MGVVPYWRLSSLYFFYFAVVGIMSPYWGVYLKFLGLSSEQIGLVTAIPMLTRIAAPNVWGWMADRSGKYLGVIRLGSVGAVCGFVGLFFFRDYWALLLFVTLFTFFWNAVLPQFEVVTLDALQGQTHKYSRIRIWGSIGFIASAVGLGVVFDVLSVALLPGFLWGFLLLIAASTFFLPEVSHHRDQAERLPLSRTLKKPGVVLFMVAALLLHVSHGPYYSFFSIYLLDKGYSSTSVGLLWALGVVAEILIFLKIPVLLRRWGLWSCYLISMLGAALRWWLIGAYADKLPVLLFAQCLHALSFAVAHSVAIEMVREAFPAVNRGSGQAFYSAACYGGGGAVGAYLTGQIWSHSPVAAFAFASLAAGLGAVAVVFGLRISGAARREVAEPASS